MLSFPNSVRIYVSTDPTDMRRSFDGLAALAHSVFQQNPLSGHLFVFANRRGDLCSVFAGHGSPHSTLVTCRTMASLLTSSATRVAVT